MRCALVAIVTLGVVLLVGGCASPLWEYDHYVVEGALMDTTCRATIDGRPFAGNVAGLGEKLRFSIDASPPLGRTITTLGCRGIVMQFDTPEGTRPVPGRYRIANRVIGSDTTVTLDVNFSGINEGRWPLAFTGVHLEAKEGYLQLDEMTGTAVRGTFHAIVRRQPNGE